MANSLYEDKFVQVTDDQIILKKYYFPAGNAKKISFNNINNICTDKEYGVNALGYKSWGMGLSKIYWAWGGVSRPKNNYILKENGDILCSGFSVENPDEFCNVLTSKGVNISKKVDN